MSTGRICRVASSWQDYALIRMRLTLLSHTQDTRLRRAVKAEPGKQGGGHNDPGPSRAADQSRLLPRFRDRAAMLSEQRATLRKAVGSTLGGGPPYDGAGHLAGDPSGAAPPTGAAAPGGRHIMPAGGDLLRLRGIPVVGARGVGGVSPRTQPERETMRRLSQYQTRDAA